MMKILVFLVVDANVVWIFPLQVEPCDICGDVGFGEVIVTCSKCKLTREHV
jgi:NADH:ubiquinone oxidoreductase subunit 3 (subunit A)